MERVGGISERPALSTSVGRGGELPITTPRIRILTSIVISIVIVVVNNNNNNNSNNDNNNNHNNNNNNNNRAGLEWRAAPGSSPASSGATSPYITQHTVSCVNVISGNNDNANYMCILYNHIYIYIYICIYTQHVYINNLYDNNERD